MRRIVSVDIPPGVETWAFCPGRFPNSAFPIGDSLEINPFAGLASIAPTIL